ncbi:MAG: IclR family transcriptional regulator [Terriglobia bacterium]
MANSKSALERDYLIQSVTRSFKIVDTIAEAEEEVGTQQISRTLGLHISTVFRFLQTLAQSGVVEQNPGTGKYRLGLKPLAWGMQVLRQMDLRRDALPFLRELNEKTREMVHMTVYDRDAAIYIEKIESPTPLRVYSEVGKAAPLHCTGVGKVLMAALSGKELAELLRRYPLKRFTSSTITQVGALKRELSRIRAEGFALDNEEHEPHIRCVAAPIRNHIGKVVASISTAGPTTRITPARLPELIEAVKEAAQKISTRLGHGYTPAAASAEPSDGLAANHKRKKRGGRKP